MRLRRRHRRWIALVALLGLLFQQVAMAAYVCPAEMQRAMAVSQGDPPCHQTEVESGDRARCEAHCHPQRSTLDVPTTATTVPAAILDGWVVAFAEPSCMLPARYSSSASQSDAHGPPIRTRFCSLLI